MQRRQALLQLHLSDQQFDCLLRGHLYQRFYGRWSQTVPDSKVYGAKMGPIWGQQDPRGPHVCHMNLAIWNRLYMHVSLYISQRCSEGCFSTITLSYQCSYSYNKDKMVSRPSYHYIWLGHETMICAVCRFICLLWQDTLLDKRVFILKRGADSEAFERGVSDALMNNMYPHVSTRSHIADQSTEIIHVWSLHVWSAWRVVISNSRELILLLLIAGSCNAGMCRVWPYVLLHD